MTNETNSITEPIEGFSDNPLDIVRVIAGLAAQYASMSEAERRGQPSPVRPDSPIVRAAQRLCTIHGYAQDGNELPGFMERAARAELTLREKFEAWFQTVHDAPVAMLFRRLVDDRRYEMLETEYAWLAYREAKK